MKTASANPPVVLAFSALDPSGASGIQSDIETAASLGCHCAPIITAMCTDGDSQQMDYFDVEPTLVIEQARSVLSEMEVRAVKLGFLGSQEVAEAVHSILNDFALLPVVSQPGLDILENATPEYEDYVEAYINLILPATNIACLSLAEARSLTKEIDTVDTTAHALLSHGCHMALITGTHRVTSALHNGIYGSKGLVKSYLWDHEISSCRGSSSTLTMSMASYLAHGFNDFQALEQAQNFTSKAIKAARYLGFGKRIPHRFFWADKNITETSDGNPDPFSH